MPSPASVPIRSTISSGVPTSPSARWVARSQPIAPARPVTRGERRKIRQKAVAIMM